MPPPLPVAAIQAPGDRPIRHRATARVIVIDRDDHVLLLHDSDTYLPHHTWWLTPGGGIDPGETPAQAAIREVAEETGGQLSEADLIGPLIHREVWHGYSDEIHHCDEVFFAAIVDRFEVDDAGYTDSEKLTMLGHRWRSLAELASTHDWIWPQGLVEVARRVLAGDRSLAEWGCQEESTLAVDTVAVELASAYAVGYDHRSKPST